MKKLILIILLISFSPLISLSKSYTEADSINAFTHFYKAKSFLYTNYDSSTFYINRCIHFFKEHFFWQGYAYCLFYKQIICSQTDNIEGLKYYAYFTFKEVRKHLGEQHDLYFVALSNLGVFYGRIGDYKKALSTLKLALEKKLSNPTQGALSLCKTYSSIGLILSQEGNNDEALKYTKLALNKGIEIYGLDRFRTGYLHMNLAFNLHYLGNHQKALPIFHKAISVLSSKIETKEAKDDITNCFYGITLCHLGLNNIDSAFYYIDKAEKIQRLENAFRPYINIENKAEAYVKMKKYREALDCFQTVLTLRLPRFKSRRAHIEIMESHQRIADMYAELGAFDVALETYQQSIATVSLGFSHEEGKPYKFPTSSSIKYPLNVVPVLDAKAQAFIKRYNECGNKNDLHAALHGYLLADTLVSLARNDLINADSKLFFNKKARAIYENAIKLCLLLHQQTSQPHFLDIAFFFAERSKAALLHLGIQEAGAKLSGGVPDSLLEKERQLKVDISFYKDRIFRGKQSLGKADSISMTKWENLLFNFEQEYRTLIETLERTYPAYFGLKYKTKTLSAQETINKLPDDKTCLISYFQGDSALFIFCLSKTFGVSVYQQNKGTDNVQLVDEFLYQLQHPSNLVSDLRTFSSTSFLLYQKLLKGYLAEHGGEDLFSDLIIIPDGNLCFVPFEVLLTKERKYPPNLKEISREYRDLPYLFKRVKIRYGYSASLLFQSTSTLNTKKNVRKLAAFAPTYEGNLALSSNHAQAKIIGKLMEGEVVLGKKANESYFKEIASELEIIHLAMHGTSDASAPMFSYLLFTPSLDSTHSNNLEEIVDSVNHEEDGMLHAYELYNMHLNAKLAVLSACESGYGKLEKSEGVFSLARAFRYAGCQSIIMSLWKADGHSTNDLLTSFYNQISKGASKSSAIHTSRIKYLKQASPDKVHPHYWSTFVLWGEDSPINSRHFSFYLTVGIIFASLISMIIYKHFRNLR